MQDGDEPCKLFVGGLSWDTTRETLYATFIKFGEITECNVMMNPENNKSRGFGFVTYKDPASVELSLASKPHIVDNRAVDAKICNKKAAALTRANKPPTKTNDKDKKIFVGGLPLNITEERCREFFSQFGNVTEVVVMHDPVKQKPRGFGFIGFDSEDTVSKLCEMHFVSFDGKQVECKPTKPRLQGQTADPSNPNAWAVAAITQQYTNPKLNPPGYGAYPDPNVNNYGIDVNSYGYGYAPQPFPGSPPAGGPMGGAYGAPGYGGYGVSPGYGTPGASGQPGYMGAPGQPPAGYDYGGGYDYANMGQSYSQQPSSYGPDRSGYSSAQQSYGGAYGAASGAATQGYGTVGYGQSAGFAGEQNFTGHHPHSTPGPSPGAAQSYHPYRR